MMIVHRPLTPDVGLRMTCGRTVGNGADTGWYAPPTKRDERDGYQPCSDCWPEVAS